MRCGRVAKLTLCLVLGLFALCGCIKGFSAGPAQKQGEKGRRGQEQEVLVFTLVRGSPRGFYPAGSNASEKVEASVWLLDPQVGAAWRLSGREMVRAVHPALSPDGRFVLFIREGERPGEQNSLAWLALDGRGELKIAPTAKFNAWWPAFSPRGDQIVYSALPDALVLQDTRGGAGKLLVKLSAVTGRQQYVRLDSVRWSPDGSHLVWEAVPRGAGSGFYPIYAMKTRGGQPRKIAEIGRAPAWSPEGDRIYYLVPVESREGGIFDPALPAYIVSVRPDGTAFRNEVVFRAAKGLGTAFGVGEKAFYYSAEVRLRDGTVVDTIVALDREKKVKRAIFKAPPGYWIADLAVGKTAFLDAFKARYTNPGP